VQQTQRYFRLDVRIPFAIQQRFEDEPPATLQTTFARQLAKKARSTLGNLSGRRDGEVKAALSATLDAMAVLEREVELLHRMVVLQSRGVDLRPTRLSIGGDGCVVQEQVDVPWGLVRVHMSLSLPGGERLVSADATAGPDAEGRFSILFDPDDPELRDLVVAFVFEQQRRERRRVLDADL